VNEDDDDTEEEGEQHSRKTCRSWGSQDSWSQRFGHRSSIVADLNDDEPDPKSAGLPGLPNSP